MLTANTPSNTFQKKIKPEPPKEACGQENLSPRGTGARVKGWIRKMLLSPAVRSARKAKPVGTLVLKRPTTVLNLRDALVTDKLSLAVLFNL